MQNSGCYYIRGIQKGTGRLKRLTIDSNKGAACYSQIHEHGADDCIHVLYACMQSSNPRPSQRKTTSGVTISLPVRLAL
jgi:hypothetical protein